MTQFSAQFPRAGVADSAALSRRGVGLLLMASVASASVVLVGCGSGTPRRPPKLKGPAKDAEVARLEAALGRLPHVTKVSLEFTDNITNGQGFMGGVYADTNDQAILDSTLDQLVRILWGTTLFYPGGISTTVISKDQTKRADYRALGARSAWDMDPEELENRYGPPGFLLQTATTSASSRSGALGAGLN